MNGHQNNKVRIGVVCITTCILITVGCTNNPDRIDCNDIEKIKIGYLPRRLRVQNQMCECGDIFWAYDVMKDTIISDRKLICEFSSLINDLKPAEKERSRDFRLLCLVIYKDKEITPKQLCMGGSWTTVYNSVLMEDNPRLFQWMNKILDWDEEDYLN